MKAIRDTKGQMTVELAVLIPIVIVVALIVINLMEFIDACAVFDVVSSDTVIAQAASPAQNISASAMCSELESAIATALRRENTCSVSVCCEDRGVAEKSITSSFLPHYAKYICTLKFRPWPRALNLPIVSYSAPIELTHKKTIVIDRFKSGVVV